jgi:hypothetical protein
MKACFFTFDYGPRFAGYSHGTTWNGFDDVSVTLATARAIDRWFATLVAGRLEEELDVRFADLPRGADGLISLAGGYATRIDREVQP